MSCYSNAYPTTSAGWLISLEDGGQCKVTIPEHTTACKHFIDRDTFIPLQVDQRCFKLVSIFSNHCVHHAQCVYTFCTCSFNTPSSFHFIIDSISRELPKQIRRLPIIGYLHFRPYYLFFCKIVQPISSISYLFLFFFILRGNSGWNAELLII